MISNIKVLIVDDSAVMRRILSDLINQADGMEVIDVARDPIIALEKLKVMKPDVITLDVEMPRMDGLTFLEKLMRENPFPVVMCSILTQKSSEISLKAFRLGAVEIVGKPDSIAELNMNTQKEAIVDAIRAASRAKLSNIRIGGGKTAQLQKEPLITSAELVQRSPPSLQSNSSNKLIAIGASTGGTQALEQLLPALAANTPGIVVVQHMPEAFTRAFAQRLDSISNVCVKEAEDGDLVETGEVLIAPGGKQMTVVKVGGKLLVSINEGPRVNRHKPSVDVLFDSIAKFASSQTLGVILTGMGDDGANGMKKMFDAKAYTVAQDAESSVIFGMPAMAIERGGVRKVCPLDHIPLLINAFGNPLKYRDK